MLFKEIIGNEKVKKRLVQSVKDNRVSHAQLFFGSAGSGTLALAIAYSQYLCCKQKQEDDSCGICSSCIKYAKLIHPDLHFYYPVNTNKEVVSKPKSIDFIKYWREAVINNPYLDLTEWLNYIDLENKQGIISVEDSADILRKLSLKSFESVYKVVIIWMPEKMNAEAGNKLLKIIEEPSDNTLFLLVSENVEQIIPTILSRTQLVKINKLSDAEIAEAIKTYCHSENEALTIAKLADGSLNEALILAKHESDNTQLQDFLQWMRHCFNAQKNVQDLMNWVENIAKMGREKQKIFILYVLHIIRESLMMGLKTELTKLTAEEQDLLTKFSPFINTANAHLLSDELNKAYSHVERNANPKVLFLDLSFKINKLLQLKAQKSVNLHS